ncbi:hypothetical protein GCM10028828_10280 [Corynebacterium tapiri]
MTLRLSAEQDRALEMLARTQGVSKHEAAVRAIVGAAARTVHHEDIAQIARTTLASYRRAEERLGL